MKSFTIKLVRFELEWVKFEITQNRFELRTNLEHYFEPTRDLAHSIFTILGDTPISSLGINHIVHYTLKPEKFDELGNKLAYLDKWTSLFENPQLLNFEVIQKDLEDRKNGYIRIKVQPSEVIAKYAIQININNHFTLLENETGRNNEMVEYLKDRWSTGAKFIIKVENLVSDING